MIGSIGSAVFAIYAATAIVVVATVLIPAIGIITMFTMSSGFSFVGAGSMIGTVFSMNWISILAALIILPLLRPFLPSLKFYNLRLAACFAIGPFGWVLFFFLTPQPDPLAGEGLLYILIATIATTLAALVTGLFYRGIERGMLKLLGAVPAGELAEFQPLTEWIIAFRRGPVYRAYATTTLMALLIVVATGIAVSIGMSAYLFSTMIVHQPQYAFDEFSPVSLIGRAVIAMPLTVFGAIAALLVLPPLCIKWPEIRFHNLILAVGFALGMLVWLIIVWTNAASVPYGAVKNEIFIQCSGASVAVALVVGLLYRRIERRVRSRVERSEALRTSASPTHAPSP